MENGYIESFNGRLRDECLNGEVFFSLADSREATRIRQLSFGQKNRPNDGPEQAIMTGKFS